MSVEDGKAAVAATQEQEPWKYRENRIGKLEAMNDPYPHKWHVNQSIPCILRTYRGRLEEGEQDEEADEVVIAGRVLSKKECGKLIFYDLHGDGERIQVMCTEDRHNGDGFRELHKDIRHGDVVGVRGQVGRSKTGELSVLATETKCLAACLHMLPRHHFGLTNQNTRYRQRYLDMMLNPETRRVFTVRARIISFIRMFLDTRGFLEVETPMMTQVAGGAAAKPFTAHHNDLNLDMYMRIAPELYLKQLVVGGFDRVYEIGRQFRNEGIDSTHNTEFTLVEWYMAYADYTDLMDMIEELVSGMVKEIHGSYKLKYSPLNKDEVELDFEPPWARYPMVDTIEERGGLQIPRTFDDETRAYLEERMQELELKLQEQGMLKAHEPLVNQPRTLARLLDGFAGYYIEKFITNKPGFIIEHPQIMSPLAKYHREKLGLTERFEAFLMGEELVNGFTELNNPMVQRRCFEEQARANAAGDEEVQGIDEAYVTALEYGLPPTGGIGMGIDRITMFFTNKHNIKEVILFPQMKPED